MLSVGGLLLGGVGGLPCEAMAPSARKMPWEHAGPGGYYQYDDPLRLVSSGAAQAMVELPDSSWLVATANGGVWKTADLLASPPHWEQKLDGQNVSCTSISAMGSLGSTVVAGCGGATSAEMGSDWQVSNSGDWGGLMASSNAGESWTMLAAFPINYYVSAVLVISPTELRVSARSHLRARDDGGVWASSDAGKSWTRTLSRPVYDLAREPTSGTLFAALPWARRRALLQICSSAKSTDGLPTCQVNLSKSATFPIWQVDDEDSVYMSRSGGARDDWVAAAAGIDWGGRTPFYPTFALGSATLFVGALTVNPAVLSDTDSSVFHIPISSLLSGAARSGGEGLGGGGRWARVANAPRLDVDGMPKDRMALLVHPRNESMLFVAGNAKALAWRVDWAQGRWVEEFGADTSDGSAPHVDCRRYYWEGKSDSLLLLSDGGAWMREEPSTASAGRWRSLAGDSAAMEFVSAHWDPVGKRWVGGAQDNTVMFSSSGAKPADAAVGFIDGDGTVTAVDSKASPPRLWGSTENMGNAASDDPGPGARRLTSSEMKHPPDGLPKGCTPSGFGFWQGPDSGAHFFCIPVLKWLGADQFPQFVNPWALLSTDPSQLFLFATAGANGKPAGLYRLSVPYTVRSADDVPPPTLELSTPGDVYAIVAGGVTAGKADPSLLVLMNDTSLLIRSAESNGTLLTRPLPVHYARPVVGAWLPAPQSMFVLGPYTHDRTVSLAVSPADSALIAVTGWESVLGNQGRERVWISADTGLTWADVTGSLREATATIGQWKPSAALMLPLPAAEATALLVGTVHGVFVSFVTQPGSGGGGGKVQGRFREGSDVSFVTQPGSGGGGGAARDSLSASPWARLGDCAALPLVLVAGLSHEPKDDTLVAATMGRGVYVVHGATPLLETMWRNRHVTAM